MYPKGLALCIMTETNPESPFLLTKKIVKTQHGNMAKRPLLKRENAMEGFL